MKKLLPLFVLVTLVSCDDSLRSRSTISNNDSTIQRYSSALSSQRGEVAYIRKQGSEFGVDFTKASGLLGTSPVNTRTTSVVLNIDGNKVYRHLTVENLITKETTRKVVMENESSQQELKEILDSGKGRVIGDNLLMQFSEELPATGNSEMELISKYSFNSTVNLWKPNCDSKTQVSVTGTLLVNGNVDSTKKFQTLETSTCGSSYNDKQLREIDLSSIEFCIYLDEENENCEADRDMSFLTSDL